MDLTEEWIEQRNKAIKQAIVDCEAALTVDEALSRRRHPKRVEVRNRAYTILRAAGWSYTKIGKAFGKDHTTIMHGVVRSKELKKERQRKALSWVWENYPQYKEMPWEDVMHKGGGGMLLAYIAGMRG